jgi:hypothetical protein
MFIAVSEERFWMKQEVVRSPGTRTKRRRRLLGLEPIFEGGWLHKGSRAKRWDVEDELLAIGLFGDVTIDLAHSHRTPAEITITAWAVFRDVDIFVAPGTHVELTGSGFRGHLTNDIPPRPVDHRRHVVRVHGHTLAADVTVRLGRD